MLPLRLGQRVAAADTEDVVGTRNTDSRTGAQDIDVAAEGFRVRLEDRQHGLVHRQAVVGAHARGNAPERLAALHLVIATRRRFERCRLCDRFRLGPRLRRGLGSRLRLFYRELRRRLRRKSRRRGRGRGRTWLCRCRTLDLAAVGRRAAARGLHGLRRATRRRRIRGRIEQQRVFAEQPAPRPGRFDKEGQERLADRRLRTQLHDVAVRATAANHRKRDLLQVERPVETVARKCICRGQRDSQVLQFFGRDRQQLDFSAQRLAERGVQPNIPKPKRPNLARQEKYQHKRDS